MMRCSECGGERGDHLPGCPIPGDEFFENFADAMRVGEPGPCAFIGGGFVYDDAGDIAMTYSIEHRRSYHVLDGDAVRTLRESSANGGLTSCVDCGKAIFVPGKPEAGIVVRGMPGGFNLKGQVIE